MCAWVTGCPDLAGPRHHQEDEAAAAAVVAADHEKQQQNYTKDDDGRRPLGGNMELLVAGRHAVWWLY